jgi:eukaryotic-like serine/threonine-protein kinase
MLGSWMRLLGLFSVTFTAVAVAAEPTPASGLPGITSWPMQRGDAAMTGVAHGSIKLPLALAWTYKLAPQDEWLPTPVIHQGRAYLGDGKGTFHAIDLRTGKVVWTHTLMDEKKKAPSKAPIEASPALIDGGVVFGDLDGILWALALEDGHKLWSWEARAEIKAAVTVVPLPVAGKEVPCVVVPDFSGQISCLQAATGRVVWTAEGSGPIQSACSVTSAGVAFGGCNGSVELIDAKTGQAKGIKVETQAPMPNAVAQADGIGYFAHAGRKVEAWNLLTGKIVWSFRDRDFEYFTTPALTADLVLAGGKDKRLHALSRATGDEKWAFRARNEVASSAVIVSGYAVMGSDDGRLYAVDLKDGTEAWSYEIGAPVKGSPAVVNGLVLVLAADGGLYAFRGAGG